METGPDFKWILSESDGEKRNWGRRELGGKGIGKEGHLEMGCYLVFLHTKARLWPEDEGGKRDKEKDKERDKEKDKERDKHKQEDKERDKQTETKRDKTMDWVKNDWDKSDKVQRERGRDRDRDGGYVGRSPW